MSPFGLCVQVAASALGAVRAEPTSTALTAGPCEARKGPGIDTHRAVRLAPRLAAALARNRLNVGRLETVDTHR